MYQGSTVNYSAPPRPTPQEQRVLERIQAQRTRFAQRRHSRRDSQAGGAPADPAARPELVFLQRLLVFIRQHPVAAASVLGGALAAGPKRLMRWAGILLPLLIRLRTR